MHPSRMVRRVLNIPSVDRSIMYRFGYYSIILGFICNSYDLSLDFRSLIVYNYMYTIHGIIYNLFII